MHESGENYLETILVLQNKNGYVRSIDIATELGFTKPSISRAMSILKKSEYITMERSGQIKLTEKGLAKANEIYERHRIISEYFEKVLGVSKEIADRDACKIEHVISPESFDKMKNLIKGNG
ncbi:MAG: metal-dependent transcriptional regulator [Oscillospiraceae bacterium]|nr:metal-dependent transcriptional regulator [Oscillospiraceae bacterium]HOV41031.1 metal-dependent transcriptional regulator [Oscillospiraceae bacterium]